MSALPAMSSASPATAAAAAMNAVATSASRRGAHRRRIAGSETASAATSAGKVAIAPNQENRPAAIVAKAYAFVTSGG